MWLRPKSIDYKERWLSAVALLGETGRLTPDEVRGISGDKDLHERVQDAKVSASTLATLHSMKSWDRASLEIARAKRGLAPVDDLEGMKSWDIQAVMEARLDHGTA